MEHAALGRWKTITAVLLTLMLSLTAFAQVQGDTGREWVDGAVNTASGLLQTSMAHPLGWLIALLVKNPKVYPTDDPEATGVVKVLLPMITSILIPLWYTLIVLNGIYFVWGSRDPASRSAARERMIRLIFGMIICSLAAPIFQLLLEIQRALTMQVLEAGHITAEEMVGGYLAGAGVAIIVVLILVKLLFISWGTALCPIIMLIIAPFVALGIRYVVVIVLAVLFPVTIFLYFFDFTKKLGSKLFRMAVLWISVPIVQAIFVVVMLEGVKAFERVNLIGGFIALACFVMIGVVPFKMENLAKSIGGALIHSGYTTSNPRLVTLGAAFSGEGPAALTTFAWYSNLGMQQPAGGSEVEKAWGKDLSESKSAPATFSYLRKGEMKAEAGQLDTRISKAEAEKKSLSALAGGGATALDASIGALDREIKIMTATKKLTSIAHISDGERRLAEQAMSFDGVRKVLDRHQMYRLMKEQEIAKNEHLPVKGYDLTKDKGRVTFAYATAPISPGEVLAPAGAFLTGFMTHIISGEMPLGKSLSKWSKSLRPSVGYETDAEGKQVAVTKEKWKTWGEVAQSTLKPLAYAGGLSLLSAAGVPLLLGATALGLSIKGVKGAIQKDEDISKNIENLDKNPAKLKEMRELAGKEREGTLSDSERKKADKIGMGFGGMKVGDVLKKHETGKLAKSRELEDLIPKAQQNKLGSKEGARVDELAKIFGLATGASALTTILNDHVKPERQKRQKEEVHNMEKLDRDDANKKLLSLSDAKPFDKQDEKRKDELEIKKMKAEDGRGEKLTEGEEKELEKLGKKESTWKDKTKLSSIFGLDPNVEFDPNKPETNLAGRIAGESTLLQQGLSEYRKTLEPAVSQTAELADPNSDMHKGMAATAGLMDVADADGITGGERLRRDEALLTYANSPRGRDELRLDAAEYGGIKDQKKREEMERDLEKKYKHGFDAFGIEKDKPMGEKLGELSEKVQDGIGLNPADDEQAYSRYLMLAGKKPSSLIESERTEVKDLQTYLNRAGTEERKGLEESVDFRNNQLEESENAKRTLAVSKYATCIGTDKDIFKQLGKDAESEKSGATVDKTRYNNDLDIFHINPADKDALQQLNEQISKSREVEDSKHKKTIDNILPP